MSFIKVPYKNMVRDTYMGMDNSLVATTQKKMPLLPPVTTHCIEIYREEWNLLSPSLLQDGVLMGPV